MSSLCSDRLCQSCHVMLPHAFTTIYCIFIKLSEYFEESKIFENVLQRRKRIFAVLKTAFCIQYSCYLRPKTIQMRTIKKHDEAGFKSVVVRLKCDDEASMFS